MFTREGPVLHSIIVDPLKPQTAIPEVLAALFRSLMRGENAPWPAGISSDQTGAFTTAIIEQGMAPLAHDALSRLSGSGWPEALRTKLRREAVVAVVAEVGSEEHLRGVLEALAAEGVPALVMKGSALARQVYPHAALRPRGDSDLLVAESSLAGVRRAMVRAGCSELPSSGDEVILRQSVWVSHTADRHVYDVHWSVSNAEVFAKTFDVAQLLGRSVPLPALGPAARALDLSDSLLLAAVHQVAHHHGIQRLIWLYDIHLLRQAMTADERRELWERADRQGVVSICRAAMQEAHSWFGGSGPADDAGDWLSPARLASAEASASYLVPGRRRLHQEWSDMTALTWRSRLRRLRQVTLPPRAYMDQRYGRRPFALLPFLYLHRGLRGVARLFRQLRP